MKINKDTSALLKACERNRQFKAVVTANVFLRRDVRARILTGYGELVPQPEKIDWAAFIEEIKTRYFLPGFL